MDSPVNYDNDPGEPLILTPLIENGKLQEAKNLSVVPDELFFGVKSYSGYLTVDKKHNSNSFFWFVPSTNVKYEDAPLILWLEGGNGQPSITALFYKNGPFITDDKKVIGLKDNSWTSNHSVLYIDNPLGGGFSFTDKGWRTTLEEIGEDLYEALKQFFKLFPEFQRTEFYIAGQSFAGKYITAVSYKIHKKNPTASVKINLKGLFIGNGVIDPVNQMNYGNYLYELGLIDFNVQQEMNEDLEKMAELIKKEKYVDAFNIKNKILEALFKATGPINISNYGYTTLPNQKYIEFLQQNHIRKAIHVGNNTLVLSNDQTQNALVPVFLESMVPYFSELLDNYRVLLYTGQFDIISNYPGIVNFLRKLNFNASEEYKTAPRHIWMEDGEVAGYVKEAGFLTEVLVRNAGHSVILDKPDLALKLISKFVRNEPIYCTC